MSFRDLFESGEHNSNLAHFASIVRIATVDGELGQEELINVVNVTVNGKTVERHSQKEPDAGQAGLHAKCYRIVSRYIYVGPYASGWKYCSWQRCL